MPRGRYIVIEGTDGAGKGEQVYRVIASLKQSGINAVPMYEPGGNTDIGNAIRGLLKDKGLPRTAVTNAYLFNAARAEALTTIKRHVEEGTWVICDRNRISTFVYQGHAEGVDLEMLYKMDAWLHELVGVKPDLEIVLQVPREVAALRVKQRGEKDYFEELGIEEALESGYQKEAERCNLPTVDASRDIEAVFGSIWKLIIEKFGEI